MATSERTLLDIIEQLETEEWRVVPDFPCYEVSNQGRIRRTHTGKGRLMTKPRLRQPRVHIPHKQCPDVAYHWIDLWYQNRQHPIAVHHLVLIAFVGPRPNSSECRHLDGNGLNNHVGNLAWGTARQNYEDRVAMGRQRLPPQPGKVTLEIARAIRAEPSTIRQWKLGLKYGISQSMVSMIRTGRCFKE
jgi:hypothetical protein